MVILRTKPEPSSRGGGIESYFHWVAKDIIGEAREILLPDGNYLNDTVLLECATLHPSIQPDAILNNELIVEICYRNVKGKQIATFTALNLSRLEVSRPDSLHTRTTGTQRSSIVGARAWLLTFIEGNGYLAENDEEKTKRNNSTDTGYYVKVLKRQRVNFIP